MNTIKKKTRNCIEPWRSVQFEAEGGITPCCSGTLKGYYGNINKDYFDVIERGNTSDIFANEDYQKLREGLLTGNLSESCRTCRAIHDADITTDELHQRVINHLESQRINTADADLTKEFAFTECGGNITNKCNFSCIYCSHSGENGHTGYFAKEMDRERFINIIDFLYNRGLKIFNFVGIGELTIYPGWQSLCKLLLEKFPQLRLRVISNFGKRLNESDLEILSKFDLIHVSCDTLDEKTYTWLRKGGKLPVLLDNIKRLREKFTGDPNCDPKLAFNITATDIITDKLEELFRFAAANNMFVHLSTLFVMEGSIVSKTNAVKKITSMSNSRAPYVREIFYDLPRRMKAENPLTNVWEYQFLYKQVMQKADKVTYNKFVPKEGELIYNQFYNMHIKNEDAYLRKLWLSFDEVIKGIYINPGKEININIPNKEGKIKYRAVWCKERIDGNLTIFPGEVTEAAVGSEFSISANNCNDIFNNMLFEVLSYSPLEKAEQIQSRIVPKPPENNITPLLVREAFLINEEENIAKKLVETQEPVIIWCAGLRTLQMLSNTSLGKANIKMIIDGNPAKKGQPFCGLIINSPEDIGDFSGKIIVIHASSPEQVEFQIRQLGFNNEVLIM